MQEYVKAKTRAAKSTEPDLIWLNANFEEQLKALEDLYTEHRSTWPMKDFDSHGQPRTTHTCITHGFTGGTKPIVPIKEVQSYLERIWDTRKPSNQFWDEDRDTYHGWPASAGTSRGPRPEPDGLPPVGPRHMWNHVGQAVDSNFRPRAGCGTCKKYWAYVELNPALEYPVACNPGVCAEYVTGLMCDSKESPLFLQIQQAVDERKARKAVESST